MNKTLRRALLLAGVFTLAGCAQSNSSSANFEKSDEIVTFEAPISGKEIVRIGFAMKMDWAPLIKALNAQFPTKQFIYDYNVTSGSNMPVETIGKIVEKKIMISWSPATGTPLCSAATSRMSPAS